MNAPALAFEKHRFTFEDVRVMRRMGVLDRFVKTELIEGELIDMPADGPRHRDWSDEIGRWLHLNLGRDYRTVPSSTLVLSEQNAPMPDWQIYAASVETATVGGGDVLLIIEQSETSLTYDIGAKADLYARHGVRDYWVIDLQTRRITVHRDPAVDGFGFKKRFEAGEPVEALLLPGLILDTTSFRIG